MYRWNVDNDDNAIEDTDSFSTSMYRTTAEIAAIKYSIASIAMKRFCMPEYHSINARNTKMKQQQWKMNVQPKVSVTRTIYSLFFPSF